MPALTTKSRARIGLVGRLREQWNNNPANIPNDTLSPNSTTKTTTNIIFSDNYIADTPPQPITDIIHPTRTNAQIKATSSISTAASRTPFTDGTSSAIFSTSILTSSDVDPVPTCPHSDHTFTPHTGLVGR
nr:unnamed protein product [Spirometra erinaceieuropaei]